MQRSWIGLALTLSLLLAGCTTEQSNSPRPVEVPKTPVPPVTSRSAAEWEAEGRRLAGEARWSEAAHAYEEAAQLRNLADLWNEASYAYLMAEQYAEGVRAGEAALKLDPKHAYALYNIGMGYLESAQPCEALDLLGRSEVQQGARWEISLAKGRAYAETDQPTSALERLQGALALGAPEPLVAKWRRIAEERLAPPSPEVLSQRGELLLQDGATSFYTVRSSAACGRALEARTWLLHEGRVERLLGGEVGAERLQAVTLPDGQRAYWVQGGAVGAGISRTYAYYLIMLLDGKQERFQFSSSLHTGPDVPDEADFVPSWSFPKIQGDQMMTGATNSAAGLYDHHVTWRIDPVQRRATQVAVYEEAVIKVEEITPTGLAGRFRNLGYQEHLLQFGLTPAVEVSRAGKPASLAEVQVGQTIRIEMKKWQIFRIELFQ